VKKILSIG